MIYSLEEFKKYDKIKSKIMKFVLYKKRTEQEVRQKFAKEVERDVLEDIIEELKEDLYINDYNYIERAVNEYINLKSMSIKEIEFKLYTKGISSKLIEKFVSNNIDVLEEYENRSLKKLIEKKKTLVNEEQLIGYLLRRGFKQENIQKFLYK